MEKYSLSDLLEKLNVEFPIADGHGLATTEDGEDYVTEEYYLKEIIEQGKLFDTSKCKTAVCDMTIGECHYNVVEIMNDPSECEEGDKVFNGYSIDIRHGSGGNYLGEWFPHSWIVDKDGKVVETFSDPMAAYFGF